MTIVDGEHRTSLLAIHGDETALRGKRTLELSRKREAGRVNAQSSRQVARLVI